ncbi:MAG TPA: ankyrin repeat domain-containing protein [Gemmataceae bacterium]|nr:ankyrin repeat domain-containing protein [Gemmataceae bacterium]
MGRYLDTALFRETRNVNGSVARVRSLIEGGADVNRRHKCGNTPLWEAAYHGRKDVVAVLLEAGAKHALYADDGSGPLHWAASRGHVEVVRMLLAIGADPNALRDGVNSILGAAISNGHAEVVCELVEAGAAVDRRYLGMTLIAFAEWCGHPAIAAILRRSRRHRSGENP